MRHLIALGMLMLPLAAGAQSGTVLPGMSRSQVVAALGAPATERSTHGYSYLYYANHCGTRCGMNDLVVLRRDSVVDAIFRSSSRRYTGVSSSPAPVSRRAARAQGAASRTSAPVRMRPPAANDTRPSIPAGEPALAPALEPVPRAKKP